MARLLSLLALVAAAAAAAAADAAPAPAPAPGPKPALLAPPESVCGPPDITGVDFSYAGDCVDSGAGCIAPDADNTYCCCVATLTNTFGSIVNTGTITFGG